MLSSGIVVCERCGLPFSLADEPHKYCARCVEVKISKARAEGVRAERERIREAVEKRYESWAKGGDPAGTWHQIGKVAAYADVLCIINQPDEGVPD